MDERAEAAAAQDTLYETLSTREVQGSRVPEAVLREVDERRKAQVADGDG